MPAEFRNKRFIYRGWKTDHISMFCEKIRNQFPTAELMMHDKDATETMFSGGKDGRDTFIMICKVEPVVDEQKAAARFNGKQRSVAKELLAFTACNEVSLFSYKRVFRKGAKTDNEFETLWVKNFTHLVEEAMPGMLGRCLIVDRPEREECVEISPIENAITAVDEKNEELKRLIKEKEESPAVSLNPLSMLLSGVIDAAVMGGTDRPVNLPAWLLRPWLFAVCPRLLL
jgi:hypothetical protein